MTGGKDGEEGMRMKKVIGVAALIMVVIAIVLIAFSSTASASFTNRTFTQSGGTLNYTGDFEDKPKEEDAPDILLVYNWERGKKAGGEEITFFNLSSGTNVSVYVEGPYKKDKTQFSGYDVETEAVPAGEGWNAEGRKTSGYFMVWDENTTADKRGGWFQVVKHKFSVELGEEREKVQEGKNFSLKLKSNNKKGKVMKLTIRDSEDYSIMNANGTDIYEILVEYADKKDFVGFAEGQAPVEGINFTEDKELLFNTSQLDMTEGKYKIILEDYATEAEDKEDITVEKIYLEVECKDVVKGDEIVVIIKSSFYEKKANVTVGNFYTKSLLCLDEGGKRKVKIPTKNVAYGRYKVTVEVCDMWDTKYVMIKRSGTSLEVPENATVGDIVHIKGTSETGDLAVFVIDDIFEGEATISDDEFEWDWDTSGELDGYYEIEVFILNKKASLSIGDHVSEDWQRKEGVDASASIILNYPAFSMTVSKCIAKGDPVVISGTATGADHVYVIVFNYRGEVMFPYTENMSAVNAVATPVEEGKWTETLSALDFGEYTVIALDKGEDGRTRAIENGKWVIGGESKTLEQRVAILMDAITFVGSDDLYAKACFSVSAPEVILKVPETVEIGTAISVKGETNIKDGTEAFVSLLFDSSVMDKTTVVVASGSVSASFNTSGLQPGRYNVAVDVSGRASDEKEVILVEEKVEESKEPIPKNGYLPEPTPEAVKEGNKSEGEFLNETREGGEEAQKKIPVHVCDLIIAVVMTSFILAVVRRRRGRRRRRR